MQPTDSLYLRRAWCLICGLPVIFWAAAGWSDDRVVVRRGPFATETLSGTIEEWTGEELLLLRSSGRRESIPAADVAEVQTSWPSDYTEALQLLQSGRATAAVAKLRAALATESRRWAQRRILQSTAEAALQAEATDQAVAALTVLYRDDPATPALALFPVLWWTESLDGDWERRSTEWLASESEPLQLAGASWKLLEIQSRTQAEGILRRLQNSAVDPRIARLAACQQWRLELTQVDTERLASWAETLNSLPEPLQAGPRLVLGEALYRRQAYFDAAKAGLFAGLLFPEQRALAAQSLLLGARSQQALGDSAAAQRLFHEIDDRFSQTSAAQAARQALESP